MMNAARRALAYGGGVVGALGGAFASQTSVEGHLPALNDAQPTIQEEVVTLPPQPATRGRSLYMRSTTAEAISEPLSDEDSVVVEDEGRSYSWVSRHNLADCLQEFTERPIEAAEIDAIVEENSSSYLELVPSQWRSVISTDSRMFEVGRELLVNEPELAALISKSLVSMLGANDGAAQITDDEASEFSPDACSSVGASLITSAANPDWMYIREKYNCTICQNVMCAPHLLVSCNHSFCGSCINQHIEMGNQDSDIVCCPKCRVQIEAAPVFEPDFDDSICAAVDAVPECADKQEWKEIHGRITAQRRREQRRQMKNRQGSSSSSSSSFWDQLKQNIPMIAGVVGAVAFILVMVAVKRCLGR